MLLFLLAATLALLVAGVALPKAALMPPAFWAHLVLALGVMTLITAAMQHFVPVLTRGRGAGPWAARLPWPMAGTGGLVLAVFLGWLPWAGLTGAAGLGLAGALAMIAWMLDRARRTLGRPHPGLAWYVAAMVCLALGLGAAAAIPWFPGAHGALRDFHVHINLYGFVGLTAVGTLQVLMPTVVGRFDGQAGARLKLDLPWAMAGALGLALGKAVQFEPLAWLGLAAWLWVLARLGYAWLSLYRVEIVAWHGQAPVLMAALIGYGAALLQAGLAVGVANGPLGIFLAGFLFPLVSGAAGQLAPVWAHPGASSAHHDLGRRDLARHGGARAALFLSAALLPLLGYRCAGMPGLTALLWFVGLFVFWLYRHAEAGATMADDPGRRLE